MKETVEQFLERGGKITKCKPFIPLRRAPRNRTYDQNLRDALKELWKGNYLDAVKLAS